MAAKSRVNTKFILILIVALGTVSVGLGALWWFRASRDATRHIAEAQRLVEEGNQDGALKAFGRAVSRAPTEMRYVHMMDELVLRMKPATQDRMVELYNTHLSLLMREADYRLDDPAAHLKLINELLLSARFVQAPTVWEQVGDAAADMYRNLREAAPERNLARLYRGVASMQSRQQLDEAVVTAAQEDIRAYLAAAPNDDFAWAMLALSDLQYYEHFRARGDEARAAAQLAKADATIAEAVAAAPDGPLVLRTRLQRLSLDDSAESRTEIQDALTRMMGLAAVSDDPLLMGDAMQLMRRMGGAERLPEAIAAVQPYLDSHPDRIDLRLQQAEIQLQSSDVDGSEASAKAVLDHPPLAVSYLARFQNHLQQRAAGLLVDAAYQRWETADPATRSSLLPAIQAARDRVQTLVSGQESNPALVRADGKLAYALGHYDRAAAKFEEILKSTAGQRDIEAMLFSANSLERTGQAGIALDRLNAAVALQPRNVTLLLERARMLGTLRRYPDALTTLQAALRLDPGNERAIQMNQALTHLAQQGSVAQQGESPLTTLLRNAESMEQQGDVDGARQVLQGSLAQNADNLALLAALSRLEFNAGRVAEASAYVEQGLDVSPQSEWFLQMRVMLEHSDPVDRIEAYAAIAPGEARDREAAQYVNLMNLAKTQDELAARHEEEFNPDAVGQAKDIAQRARARAEVHRLAAMKDGVDHANVLNHAFLNALAAKDWPTAERALAALAAADADQAGGLVLRGQMELAQLKYADAARTLTEAVERKGHSSQPWRLLGLAYIFLGNNSEAKRAFEEAYARNPNDLEMVKLYVDLLLRSNDKDGALRVVREVRPLAANDRVFRELWLTLEGDVGDRAVALAARSAAYDANPNDRLNAARLAMMLVKARPSFDSIVDERGQPKYDSVSWSRVPADQQARMLGEVSSKWRGESATILSALGTSATDFELTQVRAALLAAHGRIAEAEQVYRDFIQAQDPAQIEGKVFIALADFQKSIGRGDAALQTLEQARAHQRGDDRTVDKALADSLMLAGKYEPAIEAYRRVLAVGPQVAVELNIAESLIRLGRLDEARQQIQQVTAAGAQLTVPQRVVAELLRASMLEAEATALSEEGKSDEAERKAAEQRRVLEETQRLDPTNPVPSIHRAQSLLGSFRRAGQAGLLDEALLALRQAESLRANFPAISAVRADVYLAKGDSRRAIDELNRTLQLQPESAAARQTLVALHLRENNTDGAIDVVRSAVELNPTIPAFHEQLGDLYVTKGDFPAAAASFTRAYELDRRRAMLRKLVLAMLSVPAPDYSQALAQLSADKESLNDPVLRSFYAVTLNGMDQREEAVAQLHRAHREMRVAVAAGGNAADWASWFFAARRFFSGTQPSAIESLVMELAEGKPTVEELYQLGIVWRDSGRDGLQRAFELQKQVVAECPKDNAALVADLNFILSRYAIGVRDFAAAAAALEAVVDVQPENAVALNDLAYLLAEELGQAERARPYAEKAVSIDPRRASMLDTLGVVYHHLGMEAEAEERLTAALAIEPGAETYKHLAEVLIAQGRPQDAERQLRRGLDLKPSPAIQQEITRLLDDIKAGKP